MVNTWWKTLFLFSSHSNSAPVYVLSLELIPFQNNDAKSSSRCPPPNNGAEFSFRCPFPLKALMILTVLSTFSWLQATGHIRAPQGMVCSFFTRVRLHTNTIDPILPDSNPTLFGLPPAIRNMIWDYLFDVTTYDFKQRVPPNFFAILYTCRRANQELQTVPMRRSACVAFTYGFQLQYTLRCTFESQLSCLRNLRFGGRTDSDLRESIKVDQDDMRKLTSLEKIKFVGIAVSDETKEIVAMMGQIYSRDWCFALHVSYSRMTSDLTGRYYTTKNKPKMATNLIGQYILPPILNRITQKCSVCSESVRCCICTR